MVVIRRNRDQWLEMIRRTRPTAFAVQALEREFLARSGTDGLSDAEATEVRAALEALSRMVRDSNATASSTDAPILSTQYRTHGKGRLYLEVTGREQHQVLESDSASAAALDALHVYLFGDPQGFAGLQVDDANTLPERLGPVLTALRALETELALPRLDCPEAGLEQATISETLAWASVNRVEAGR